MALPDRNIRFAIVTILSLAWLGFQIHFLFSPQPPMIGRPLHLGFALLIFLLGSESAAGRISTAVNGLLACGVIAVLLYYFVEADRLASRMEAVDPVFPGDILFGSILVLVALLCVRRTVGWSLLAVILAFLIYAFIGQLLPGWTSLPWIPELIKFSGFTLGDAAENFTMTPNGLLGVTTATSLTFVFYFVLFGALYSGIGGGQLFIDIGLRFTGRQRGGPAKAAVVASGLMGSISGSAVANVATTGIFTIPLMRRAGYHPTMAGAIEAIASTGGQLMPPVMGIAAFVMADLLQEDYLNIAMAGLIPALAFYLSIFLAVDLHARRVGLKPANRGKNDFAAIAPRLYLLLPLALLLFLLFRGLSANLCATWAMAACVLIGVIQRKLTARQWIEIIVGGTRQAAQVAIPIAAIGLIIEVAVQSSLVLKFSVSLIELGGGTMIGAMLWIILGCILMGMGLPTVAAYIIGAILFVPALLDFGLPKLGAHFFVMYYCVLSMITPPIALASYTAAGLAGAPVMKTCFAALRLSAAAFVIPFAFVFSPPLLAQGAVVVILAQCTLLFAGTAFWAIGAEGYLLQRSLKLAQRFWFGLLALFVLTLPATAGAFSTSTGWSPGLTWSVSLALVAGAITLGTLWCLRNERGTRVVA